MILLIWVFARFYFNIDIVFVCGDRIPGKREYTSVFLLRRSRLTGDSLPTETDQASQRGPDDHPMQKNQTGGRAAKGRSTSGSATYAQPS